MLTLTDILFARNQLAIFCNSVLTLIIKVGRSESESTTAVSSAKRRIKSQVATWRSLMKQRNKIGPRILPWSTDISIAFSVDLEPFISVY